jgi:DNA-binding winged helix-turn-helix (wHTH) protein/Tfp pilus assembly protein PilF
MQGPERYAFGAFSLDVVERRVLRAGDGVSLPPKVFDLLVALVREAPRLLTKRALLDAVWPDSFVEEGILSVHVSSLRKALGEGVGGVRYIETVARSGYRFVAPVVAAGSGNGLGLFPLPGGEHLAAARAKVHELLGQGRMRLLSVSMKQVRDAVPVFQAAIALDPTYAPAHAGLALAWCAQAEARVAPFARAYAEARASALRALALDSASADAQVALSMVLFLGEWDWVGAERSITRALALDPGYTEAYLLYGRLLEALGLLDEGLAMKLKALERDPNSPAVHLQISLSYWNQRRYDDSIEWANRTLALDANHLLAREHIAGAYLKKGDVDRHMAENLRHAETFGCSAETLAPLRDAYAAGGRAGVVRFALEQLTANEDRAPAMQLAILHGEAGNRDEAYRYLNKAIDSHDPCLVHLAVGPQWDDLRGDPRFAACLARMGLATPVARA